MKAKLPKQQYIYFDEDGCAFIYDKLDDVVREHNPPNNVKVGLYILFKKYNIQTTPEND